MPSRFQGKNYYDILGVQPTASLLDIRRAFRKLAVALHPDKADEAKRADATIDFQYLVNVMDVLSDPHKRDAYDLQQGENDAFVPDEHPTRYYEQRYVNILEILKHQDRYVGTEEEMSDVCASYEKRKGNMTEILEDIMHATDDDAVRFRSMIENAQRSGRLKSRHAIYFGKRTEISLEEEPDLMLPDENGFFEPIRTNASRDKDNCEHKEILKLIHDAEEKEHKKKEKEKEKEKDKQKEKESKQTTVLAPTISMREKNQLRHQALCSSLEKRFRPKNHVNQELTEEEFQRAALRLRERKIAQDLKEQNQHKRGVKRPRTSKPKHQKHA